MNVAKAKLWTLILAPFAAFASLLASGLVWITVGLTFVRLGMATKTTEQTFLFGEQTETELDPEAKVVAAAAGLMSLVALASWFALSRRKRYGSWLMLAWGALTFFGSVAHFAYAVWSFLNSVTLCC